LVDEFGNPYLCQVSVRFVPNESHCEDVAQRGCDEVGVLADEQFEPSREILICTHGEIKREMDLNVTHRYAVSMRWAVSWDSEKVRGLPDEFHRRFDC
jgi:hypothetical protein